MVEINVIKKDLTKEKFKPEKIIKSLKEAGASDQLAKKIAEEVTEEISKVSTKKIRDLIIDRLKVINTEAKESWENYEQYNKVRT
ncbi:MAG: hypothetical protein GF329_00265 [Candidatus Lokiarchaeota archaeon]|nr:hypothetical protein [Candidatus Lokiarchaeota archaeon]